jgi:cobalamin biosynthesis protein CbiG
MKKALFVYKKQDGSSKEREILAPKFLKESFNYFKNLEHASTKYISGYEIDKEGLTEEQIKQYQEALDMYLDQQSLEEICSDAGLDPKKIGIKSFSKTGVEQYREEGE